MLNGIFWVSRSGAPWRDLPPGFGPYTSYNRFVRWRRAGVWSRIMEALAAADDAAVEMIDSQWCAFISTLPASLVTRDNPWADREAP